MSADAHAGPVGTSERRLQLELLRQIRETRLVTPALVFLAVVVVCAVAAPVVSPADPNTQDYSAIAQPPSWNHLLGTDEIGRDILARLIFGARISLQVGIITVFIAVSLGLLLGLVSGYMGGLADEVAMRFVDAVQAFPSLVLALAITAALGPGVVNTMVAIGFVSIPAMARLTRGQVLSVRETEYVLAARVVGASDVRIMVRHILPNVIAPIIVQATLLLAVAILVEASLSFLGVGVEPPTPTWGGMLRSGSQYLETAPWIAFAPGVAIFLTVLSINIVGDGLRRALDPRLRTRRRG